MRNRYDRIYGNDLEQGINDLDLTLGQFARLVGVQRNRVLGWIKDRQDIPHHINVMLDLLALPGGIAAALKRTNEFIQEREPDEEEESAMPDTS